MVLSQYTPLLYQVRGLTNFLTHPTYKLMADLSITPSAVIPSMGAQRISNATAGATIAAGELVYQDTTDGNKFKLSDGNDANKLPVTGIAINSASAGQPISVVTYDPALTIGAHGQALGTPFFQSATPGKVCPFADLAAGNFVTCTFIILSTTTVYFKPCGPGGAIPA